MNSGFVGFCWGIDKPFSKFGTTAKRTGYPGNYLRKSCLDEEESIKKHIL